MPSDKEMVGRALSGDAEAFPELVCRHDRAVAAVCHRMIGDEHEALDAVQDTFR